MLLHKYWKTALMSATSIGGDSPLFIMDYLLRILRVLVLLSIWRTILPRETTVGGMTLQAVLTYTLIAEVFREQLAARTELDTALWEGSIATRFLRPMDVFGSFIAETFGRWLFGFGMFSLPLLLLAPVLGVNPLPASPSAAALFVLSLGLAIAVGLALEFMYGAVTVWLEQAVWAVNRLRAALTTLLSGALLPLPLLPWGVGEVFGWLPFASMASSPLLIYTATGNAAQLIAVQLFWTIILWPFAYWLWRINRERLVVYGG